MRTLFLNNNKLTDISPLRALNQLQKLFLGGNQLTDVSPLTKIDQLQTLTLWMNQVTDASPLSGLDKLQKLDLSGNQLTNVSPLRSLNKLQDLQLADNQLTNVSSLRALDQLKILDLSRNQITDLVPLLGLLKGSQPDLLCSSVRYSSQGLSIYQNPLPSIVYDLIGEDNHRLVNYLEQIERAGKNIEKLYEAKLIVVGEPGAGKTSLSEKLLDPEYQLTKPDDKESTTGINILHWSFPIADQSDHFFKANIWDFGGQHIQYMTHQFFLTPSAVYVLVASNDRKELQHFPYWFKITNLLGRDKRSNQCSPVSVLLNERKNTDPEHPVFTINFDRKRYIDQYPDLDIADSTFDLDASTADLQAFTEQLQRKLLSLRHVGDPVPAQWISIRNTLAEQSKEVDYISWSEFQAICSGEGMTNEQYQLTFSYRLHILGSILHFQDDDVLADRVILNPEWAVDAVYSVLKSPDMTANRGYFKEETLKQVWGQRYTEGEQRHLLRMMSNDNFEICYEIDKPDEDQKCFIAPQFLPEETPDYDWKPEKSLKFRFSYAFMPEGILTRLIVRKHEDISHKENRALAWKRGVILEYADCLLQVIEREDDGRKVIDIEAIGKRSEQKYALRQVRDEVEKIHQRWFKGINVEAMVPCQCESCLDSDKPHFFKYSVLQNYSEKKREKVVCDSSVTEVAVRGLLEGVYQSDELPSIKREEAVGKGGSVSYQIKDSEVIIANGEQPVIKQAKGDAKIVDGGNVETQNFVHIEPTDSRSNAETAPLQKPWYKSWILVCLAVGIAFGLLVGVWLQSVVFGIIGAACAFAVTWFFDPNKAFFRAASLCLGAVIINPIANGLIGQNPNLEGGNWGFLLKFSDPLPTTVLLGLLGLSVVLFVLHYLKNK